MAPKSPQIATIIVKYRHSMQDDSLLAPQQPKNPTIRVKRPIPMMTMKKVE